MIQVEWTDVDFQSDVEAFDEEFVRGLLVEEDQSPSEPFKEVLDRSSVLLESLFSVESVRVREDGAGGGVDVVIIAKSPDVVRSNSVSGSHIVDSVSYCVALEKMD